MSETTPALVGTVIDGRYDVQEYIGGGVTAGVYRATDTRLGRDIAIKVLEAQSLAHTGAHDLAAPFRKEARAAARLVHPGLVRVFDQGTDGELTYLTMELLPGPTLRTQLQEERTLSLNSALSITEKILDALSAAHRQGLVHRDIKPENVLIDAEGEPKVADFGLARAITAAHTAATGTLLGTVEYVAPELVRHGNADARTDVYAVGVMLYEMVTGRLPFTGGTPLDIAHRHVTEDVPPASTHIPWLPSEVDELIRTFTARDPDHRPPDARAAIQQLRRTRSMMDGPTLTRRADPPTGGIPQVHTDNVETHVFTNPPAGSTVSLPIGLQDDPHPSSQPVPVTTGTVKTHTPTPSRVWWISAAVVLVATVAGLGTWWFGTFGPGAYTDVPDVSGLTVAEAREQLTEADFLPEIQQSFDDDVPAGQVVGTSPESGEATRRGSTVFIIVSKGPVTTTIPTLVGIDVADASSRLAELAFPDPIIETVYSDTVPAREVIDSTPEQGSTVNHDTVITLVVSDGPEPIVIPDVVGVQESAALDQLSAFNLDITVTYGRTLDVGVGRVYQQDPAGDSAGFRTQEITVWVSEGKPLVEVPNFTFSDVDVAKDRAEDLGLTVILTPRFPWSEQTFVWNQSIDPFTKIEVGSTITLTYDG